MKKSVQHPKRVQVLLRASQRATTTLFRGPAGTCRVLMRETGSPLLQRPQPHDESTRQRLSARLVPKVHSRWTNPTRRLRSRRISVQEASPNARPSPTPYDRSFRVDPGSLAECMPTDQARHTLSLGAFKPRPRWKNTAIPIELAAHETRSMRVGHSCPSQATNLPSFSTADELSAAF